MSVEQHNKDLVTEFLKRFGRNDVPGVLDMMDEECTWWIGGKVELFPLAGVKSKDEMRGILGAIVEPMPNGLEMRLRATTAEGERVAAEVESYGEAANGRIYNNDYHFLFRVRDGKMIEIKEYLDTMHTKAVFID